MAEPKRLPLKSLLDPEQREFLQLAPSINQKETKLEQNINQAETMKSGYETITLRAESAWVRQLDRASKARKKSRQFPWTKWEIVTEALKEWFERHPDG